MTDFSSLVETVKDMNLDQKDLMKKLEQGETSIKFLEFLFIFIFRGYIDNARNNTLNGHAWC